MDGRGAMAASATASSNGSALGILKAIGSLMWAILYILVVLPIQIVLTTLSTLFASIVQYFPLLLILVGLIFIGNTWISSHQQVTQDFEEFWRCELYPVFFGPIPTLIDGLATPYEEAICYYNAVAFTNRILSKKTVTKILAECPTPSSYYHPIIGIVKTLFNTVAAIARWVVGFYKYKLPLWPTLTGLSDVLEIIVRMINCLCEDLHPGFFYVARIISNEHLYCAVRLFLFL